MHDAHELAGMSLFADLGPGEIAKVHESFEEQVFESGERALRQGIKGTGFHVILDGEAEWHINGRPVDDAGRVSARPLVLKRGDFFGELSILFGEPSTADVVATKELHCLVLPAPAFESFLYAHPTIMYRLLLAEARRVRDPERWQR
jgi:CRP-like cAMP-binding protein